MVALPVVPLRERVVEVEVDLGKNAAKRYRYGSGYRLSGRLLLTAAHVVANAPAAEITVRGPDKVPHPAHVVEGLVGDPDTVDLALLKLSDETAELPGRLLVGVVDREAPVPVPVEGCWAVGYPLFQEVSPDERVVRETAQVWGMILPAENLVGELLSLQVTSAPRDLPEHLEALGESQWSGMSGAAVFAADRLLGVVNEHAPRRGKATITVTPLTHLDRLTTAAAKEWWAHLAADPTKLVTLPYHRLRAEPAYRATLRQVRARTRVLKGRDGELAQIGAFATGQPNELAPAESQHAWMVGGAWAGKTALLAEAVHALPPEVDCVAYFLTRPTGDADRERFLTAVLPQLAWLLDTDPPAARDEHIFRQLWEQAAQHAADEHRQLLLIVDGLDEDLRPAGHSVAGWLPGRLPGLPARVLVASRPYPGVPDDVDPAHPLAVLRRDEKLYPLSDSPHATRLLDLADQEIIGLLRRAHDDLAYAVLGLLTAARGPLAIADLAMLTDSRPWKVRGVLDREAARTLQRVGPTDRPRYTFAHETLLARCQKDDDVGDPRHIGRIEEWAATWRDRGWPAADDGTPGTPLYLLDNYPKRLYNDPPRLAALVGHGDWVAAAIRAVGVDAVLAEQRTASAAAPTEPWVAAMQVAVGGQAHQLRNPRLLAQPGYVLRQLCLQAAELTEDRLADALRAKLRAQSDPGPVPVWTTRRSSWALSRELARQNGAVRAIAVLPDGRVVSGGDDRRVLVWDPKAPQTSTELGRHDASVRAIAVLPDGRVVSGGDDARVLVWDPKAPQTGPTELGHHHDDAVYAVAVLPDGRVVSGGDDARVLVWDPKTPQTGPTELGYHQGDSVLSVAVLPDGRVVSGGDDRRVLVWDPDRSQTDPLELGRHRGWVWSVAVLPDGRVVSGGWDRRVLVWDPRVPQTDPIELGYHHGDSVWSVVGLPDGRVVSGGDDRRVLVWDPRVPQTDPLAFGRHHGDPVYAVAVLPDGRVVSGGNDASPAPGREGRSQWVLVWDPDRSQTDPLELGRHRGWVWSVAVLPDGRVVSGGDDARVLVWDPKAPQTPAELGRHHASVRAIAVLPDGRVVSGGDDARVLVWDPRAPQTDPVELGHAWVRAIAVLPDGRVVSGGNDARVLVWDPGSQTDPIELGCHRDPVRAIAVLPDGRVVSGGWDRRVLVWDPKGSQTDPIELGCHRGWVRAIAVLPDGRVVSGGTDARVLVWDVRRRTEIAQLSCSVTALGTGHLGADESRLIVAHDGGGFSVWSVKSRS